MSKQKESERKATAAEQIINSIRNDEAVALTVACPYCGQLAGIKCIDAPSSVYRTAHIGRVLRGRTEEQRRTEAELEELPDPRQELREAREQVAVLTHDFEATQAERNILQGEIDDSGKDKVESTEPDPALAARASLIRQLRTVERELASGVAGTHADQARVDDRVDELTAEYRRLSEMLDSPDMGGRYGYGYTLDNDRWAQNHALGHEVISKLDEVVQALGGRPAGRGESHSSAAVKTSTRGIDIDAKAYEGSPTDGLAGRAVDLYFETERLYNERKAQLALEEQRRDGYGIR